MILLCSSGSGWTFFPAWRNIWCGVLSSDGTDTTFAILRPLLNTPWSFDTLHLALYSMHYGSGLLAVGWTFSMENFCIHNKNNGWHGTGSACNFWTIMFLLVKIILSLDSTSGMVLDKMSITPYVNISNESSRVYTLKIQTAKLRRLIFPFSSEGMFDVVRE